MDNYKILNTKTNAIIKLLNELGYAWVPTTNDCEASLLKAHWILAEITGDICHSSTDSFYEQDSYKELSFNQLNDLVVLKRNDINDANCIDKKREAWYLASDGTYYAWQYRKLCWDTESDACVEAHDIEPINQPQDPSLISGAEAKLAWAKGIDIQIKNVNCVNWYDLDESKYNLDIFDNVRVDFRLKPQTIKLELELPKPFEPEEDCHVYILDDGKTDGYRRYSYEVHGDKGNTFIGIWRTEEEIKQVVAQLRKIRGTNS